MLVVPVVDVVFCSCIPGEHRVAAIVVVVVAAVPAAELLLLCCQDTEYGGLYT